MTPKSGALRIGTRPSALALAQSTQIADRLRSAGHECELVEVSTKGDRSSAPVAELGVGVFVSALRDALAAGEVDVAVHSYKDLPTAPDPRPRQSWAAIILPYVEQQNLQEAGITSYVGSRLD